MNKNDKRFIKTENLIIDTFIEELKCTLYDKISVVDICDKCLISKHAFYTHFNSKSELLIRIESDLIDKLINQFEELMDEDTVGNMSNFHNTTYDYISKHYNLFYTLFNQDETINFSLFFKNRVKKYVINDTKNFSMREILSINFMLEGDVSILKNWVLHYHCQDIDEVKKLAEELLSSVHLYISKI